MEANPANRAIGIANDLRAVPSLWAKADKPILGIEDVRSRWAWLRRATRRWKSLLLNLLGQQMIPFGGSPSDLLVELFTRDGVRHQNNGKAL
jgi:hypothetical protein